MAPYIADTHLSNPIEKIPPKALANALQNLTELLIYNVEEVMFLKILKRTSQNLKWYFLGRHFTVFNGYTIDIERLRRELV